MRTHTGPNELTVPRRAGLLALFLLLACGDKDTRAPDDTATSGDSGDTGDGTDSGEVTDTGDPVETLAAGFEAGLTRESGCSDVVMYAHDESDTLALHFFDAGLVAAAHAAGEPVSQSWELSTEQPARLSVTVGTHLTNETCNDVVEYSPVIDGTWVPVSGTLTLTVTPDGTPTDWEMPADAVLEFTGVGWVPSDAPTATPVPMADWTLEAHVGWLPG